jgi:Na+-driven multidrug efflux pump
LPVLYVVSGSALFIATGFQVFSGVSGTGNTRVSLFIEILVIVMYLVGVHIIVNIVKANITMVWCVEYIYGMFIGIFSILYLRSGKWRHKSL